MNKYRLMIEGKNFVLKGKAEKLGFYTTRYVEGANEEEATNRALDLIRTEIKGNVEKDTDANPEMFVKEIVELESFEDANVPGSGFSWFPMQR